MDLPQQAVPGELRKLRLAEFGRLAELMEAAFADQPGDEERSFRAELQSLRNLLPLLRLVAALRPGLEDLFYTLVWDTGERLAAAVTISQEGGDRRRWYLINLATHPELRGRGLARTMVNAALDRIRLRGGRCALLDVRADNEPAYRFYNRLGFQRLGVSTLLRGEARSSLTPVPSMSYTLRPLAASDWRTRLSIARRVASPEALATHPPTAEQFRDSALARGLLSLMRWARRVRWQLWAVEEAAQPIGLVSCQMRRSGLPPHYAQIELPPDHLAAAPYALGHAIRCCGELRPGPMTIELSGESADPIDFLRAFGFAVVETKHRLGRSLD